MLRKKKKKKKREIRRKKKKSKLACPMLPRLVPVSPKALFCLAGQCC